MTTSTNSPNILLKCAQPDLNAHYIRLTVQPHHLDIDYLDLVDQQLVSRFCEVVPYDDAPEAQEIHDGLGWNLAELGAWIAMIKAITWTELMRDDPAETEQP